MGKKTTGITQVTAAAAGLALVTGAALPLAPPPSLRARPSRRKARTWRPRR